MASVSNNKVLLICACFILLFSKETYSKISNDGQSFNDLINIIDKEIFDDEEEFSSKHCSCGEENTLLSSRIVGGEKVNIPGKYPWMVAQILKIALTKYKFYCGGALISKQYVITAAHCLEPVLRMNMTSKIRLLLGQHSIPIIPYPVKGEKFIVHPGYGQDMANDIALIKLEKPVKFSDTIRPICLPRERNFVEPTQAMLTGWGVTSKLDVANKERLFQLVYMFFTKKPSLQSSRILQEITLSIVPNRECHLMYKGVYNVSESIVCATGAEKGPCFGDSGGSLIAEHKGRWYTMGVVSISAGCGVERFPALYTRVSHYLEWIRDETRDAPPCQLE